MTYLLVFGVSAVCTGVLYFFLRYEDHGVYANMSDDDDDDDDRRGSAYVHGSGGAARVLF